MQDVITGKEWAKGQQRRSAVSKIANVYLFLDEVVEELKNVSKTDKEGVFLREVETLTTVGNTPTNRDFCNFQKVYYNNGDD